jgi:hypothetical protein
MPQQVVAQRLAPHLSMQAVKSCQPVIHGNWLSNFQCGGEPHQRSSVHHSRPVRSRWEHIERGGHSRENGAAGAAPCVGPEHRNVCADTDKLYSGRSRLKRAQAAAGSQTALAG